MVRVKGIVVRPAAPDCGSHSATGDAECNMEVRKCLKLDMDSESGRGNGH